MSEDSALEFVPRRAQVRNGATCLGAVFDWGSGQGGMFVKV